MISEIIQLLSRTAHRQIAPDNEARSVEPFYTDLTSLLVSHAVLLVLNIGAAAQIGGWSDVLLVGNALVFALRLAILRRIARVPQSASEADLLRWRRPYQAVGCAWSSVGALLGCVCIVEGDESLRLIAIFLMLGTTAGIASHSRGTPRFVLAQIAIWLLPFATVNLPVRFGHAIVVAMTVVYFLALRAMVLRHAAVLKALIDAERISRRQHAMLLDQEAGWRSLFENTTAGVAEHDLRTGRVVRMNRMFCDLLGLREQDVLKSFDPSLHVHPDDRADQTRQWSRIRETGEAFACERRLIQPNGDCVWVHLSVSVARSETDGKPTSVVAVVQDITKRKTAEAALQSSQNLLNLSTEIGGVGSFRRDYVAGLIFCGQETRMMIGLPLGDLPVPAEAFIKTVLPEDLPRHLKDAADAHAERRPIVVFDYRFIHPEKGVRYAETRSRVEYDATGRAVSSVGVVIDVTERRRAESKLAHLAHHDPLTNLPNRSLFRIRLDQALERARAGEGCAVLCLDLDQFKDVNDSLGHPIGDILLQAVTERLLAACRSTDTVARLGGDEFAIILSPARRPDDVRALAERIIAAIARPFEIEQNRVLIGTSIGIVLAPEDGLDPDHLVRNADMALYGAKDAGRGCYRFFEPAMDEKVQARRNLCTDVRDALADEELELFYQPLVEITGQRIRGFEALLRWRHPQRGLVMPDAFIPVAEANGLIVQIGAFVLHRACVQAALWPRDVSVAVNLSASEFTSPDLVSTVVSALRRSTLEPRRLELEITESAMLQESHATMETLRKLKDLGVRISIDDFGTGFSSLGYLQRFPFDKVKIDRSFVAPLGQTRQSLAIVGAVVNLCAGLDMETTAEGVETESQLAILRELGCTEAQGYFFSRARPAGEIPQLLLSDRLGHLSRGEAA